MAKDDTKVVSGLNPAMQPKRMAMSGHYAPGKNPNSHKPRPWTAEAKEKLSRSQEWLAATKNNTSPRGYLSYSQMQLYLKDPQLFYQCYIEGLQQFRTDRLILGKRMATALENGFDEQRDPMIEMVMTFMPSYPLREYEMNGVFEGIPLKGKLDGFDKEGLRIGEYKTGVKWTQGMVDCHGQLTFYALLVKLNYGVLPNEIKLHWARTQKNPETGGIELTGETKTFLTKRTMSDLILFSKKIKEVWKGVCEVGAFAKI